MGVDWLSSGVVSLINLVLQVVLVAGAAALLWWLKRYFVTKEDYRRDRQADRDASEEIKTALHQTVTHQELRAHGEEEARWRETTRRELGEMRAMLGGVAQRDDILRLHARVDGAFDASERSAMVTSEVKGSLDTSNRLLEMMLEAQLKREGGAK